MNTKGRKIADIKLINILDNFIEYAFKGICENIPKDPNDAQFPPIALGISEEQDHLMRLSWNDTESKINILRTLGEKCYYDKLFKIVIIVDAVYKTYDKKPDHLTDQPLCYPPGMRKECLILLYLDFMDSKKNLFKIHPYKIENDTIVRDNPIEFDYNNLEMMDSLIMSNISFGFTKTALLDLSLKKEITGEQLTTEIGDMLLKEMLSNFPGATLGLDLSRRNL